MTRYSIKEIYLTKQGEGHHTGKPAIFIRFSGCNLWSGLEKDRKKAICDWCDTDFVGTNGINGGHYDIEKIIKVIKLAFLSIYLSFVENNLNVPVNIMPMLIFHCRTRLFLAFIQQRTILGGAPTIRLQVQPMNFTLIPHQISVMITKYILLNKNQCFF